MLMGQKIMSSDGQVGRPAWPHVGNSRFAPTGAWQHRCRVAIKAFRL